MLSRAFLLGLLACFSVQAAVPEPGFYWDPRENGKGYYIELQGNVVVVVAYASRPNGDPIFYIGSGDLQPDSPGPPDYDIVQPTGTYPIQKAVIDLFEIRGGPCLACTGSGVAQTSQTARIALWWVHSSQPTIELLSDGVQHQPFELQRFNFALPTIASFDPVFRRTPDLRGEWVFTEVTDPAAVPVRLNFSERTEASGVVTYRDPPRSAQARCFIELSKQPGCEFSVGGTVQFSAQANDIGLARIQAYRGDLLPRSGLTGRRAETFIGYRIQR